MSSALPHGGEECIANTSDCLPQTKHILCGEVIHGVRPLYNPTDTHSATTDRCLQTCIRKRSVPVVFTVTKTNMLVVILGMDC